MTQRVIEVSKAEFAESFLHLNGRPLNLDDYYFLRPIYDDESKEIVLKFSRQTSKSTTLANLMITNSATIPFFKTLYIAPTVNQSHVFSHDRVGPVMTSSPLIQEYYLNSKIVQNVHTKQLLNGSRMYLRYALLSADHLRGYSADMNLFDECQDLKQDIIPVVAETMTRSLYKRTLFAGTPKRTKGTLADKWFKSTQSEFMIKCEHCNKWNILDEDSIGDFGVICKKCKRELKILGSKGEWVSTYSQASLPPELTGYRVCLLHFAKAPWVDWNKDILQKRRNVSTALFKNEVLALEHDEGVAPITRKELITACVESSPMNEEPSSLEKSYESVMGIDYGPINSTESNTVISVVQMRAEGMMHVVYAKKFIGKEADYVFIHNEVPRLMAKWNCSHLAADYGMGEAPNAEIRGRIGYDKVIAFQHMPAQKDKARWNPKMPAYTLGRNQVMTDMFSRIKNGKLKFPRWMDISPFMDDLLNIQTEYNEEMGKMKYVNIGPDDFFHATLYATISAELAWGISNIS